MSEWLGKIGLPAVNIDQAKVVARAAVGAVRARQLGYVIVVTAKPG